MPYDPKTHFRSGGNSQALRLQFNAALADAETFRTGSGVLSDPDFRIGTSSAKELKHDAFEVRINGVTRFIAADEVAFAAPGDDIASHATDFERWYNFSIAQSGIVIITAGAVGVPGATSEGAVPAGNLDLGSLKLTGTTNVLWDATTHDLDEAANITASVYESTAIETPTALALTN